MVDRQERLQRAVGADYAVEGKIGSGGMATVYRARDLKHDRQVAIKVVDPEIAARVGIERFLREIAISAKLRHPNILPLYDSGDVDGVLYYVMPFVDGQTLGDRLRSEGSLPLDDALQITREVADALSFAHSHGFIHRDIKPDNILIDAGHAVLADFGIARAMSVAEPDRVTATGATIGTPGYMSPEQLSGSGEIDARSDIYSLACVLYEMLAGEAPYTGPSAHAILAKQMATPAPRVSVVRSTVPGSVEAALRKALAQTPADRFATASEFSTALTESTAETVATPALPERRRWITRPRLGVAVGVALGAVIGATVLSGEGNIPFEARDFIVIADFENRTGDPAFDRSLNTALEVGVSQSRHVNVLPPARVATALRLMGREDDTPLTEPVAVELALRAGATAVVVPSIDAIDSLYLLTTRTLDPSTGDLLLSRSSQAEGKGEVLSTLDGLARRLRRDLGESRFAVAGRGVRLDQATTPSLDALVAWSEGNDLWNRGDRDAAFDRFQRAIELDSNFAMAHMSLGGFHYFAQDRPRGEVHFEKALSLIDRVTERERMLMQADAAGWRGDRVAQAMGYETYLMSYPDDARVWFNLGNARRFSGREDDAVAAYEQVLALDSTHGAAYLNLATLHNSAGRHEEALSSYLRARELEPGLFNGNVIFEFGVNYIQLNDFESARRVFEEAESGEERAMGLRALARLDMYQGRVRDAVPRLEIAVRLQQEVGRPVSEFRDRHYLLTAYQLQGAERGVEAQLAQLGRIVGSVYLDPSFLLYYGQALARRGRVDDATAVLALVDERANASNPNDRAMQNHLRGEIALARGEWEEALQELEVPPALFPTSNLHLDPLARAYRRIGDLERAVSAYEQIVALRQIGYEAQELWILAHYYLGEIHEERGDTAEAVQYFERFVEIWKEGDDDLPLLRDARERLRVLRGAPG